MKRLLYPVITRTSMRNFTHTGDLINIPLNAVSELTRLIGNSH